MKPSELLKNIQTLLSAKVELAQEKLMDGMILEAESFEPGMPVYIVTDNGPEPLEKGEYKLENGKTLVVAEDGIIDLVKEVEEEIEVEASAEVVEEQLAEEPMVEEVKEEVIEDAPLSQQEIIDAVISVVSPMLEEMRAQLEDVKMKIETAKETKMSKVVHTPEVKQTATKLSNNKKNNVLETIFEKLN